MCYLNIFLNMAFNYSVLLHESVVTMYLTFWLVLRCSFNISKWISFIMPSIFWHSIEAPVSFFNQTPQTKSNTFIYSTESWQNNLICVLSHQGTQKTGDHHTSVWLFYVAFYDLWLSSCCIKIFLIPDVFNSFTDFFVVGLWFSYDF